MNDQDCSEMDRVCFGGFDDSEKPLLGFSCDETQVSISYLEKFKCFQSSLPNPVGALKHLPEKYIFDENGSVGIFSRGIDEKLQAFEVEKGFHPGNSPKGSPHLSESESSSQVNGSNSRCKKSNGMVGDQLRVRDNGGAPKIKLSKSIGELLRNRNYDIAKLQLKLDSELASAHSIPRRRVSLDNKVSRSKNANVVNSLSVPKGINIEIETKPEPIDVVDLTADEPVKFEGIIGSVKPQYRIPSPIPYLFKCGLQNPNRRCKDLHLCSNANKKFELYFVLTVGRKRPLPQVIVKSLENEEDPCKISKSCAYIAASAVQSHPSTILVPAVEPVVSKILPKSDSTFLMEKVGETREIERQKWLSGSSSIHVTIAQDETAIIAEKTIAARQKKFVMSRKFSVVGNDLNNECLYFTRSGTLSKSGLAPVKCISSPTDSVAATGKGNVGGEPSPKKRMIELGREYRKVDGVPWKLVPNPVTSCAPNNEVIGNHILKCESVNKRNVSFSLAQIGFSEPTPKRPIIVSRSSSLPNVIRGERSKPSRPVLLNTTALPSGEHITISKCPFKKPIVVSLPSSSTVSKTSHERAGDRIPLPYLSNSADHSLPAVLQGEQTKADISPLIRRANGTPASLSVTECPSETVPSSSVAFSDSVTTIIAHPPLTKPPSQPSPLRAVFHAERTKAGGSLSGSETETCIPQFHGCAKTSVDETGRGSLNNVLLKECEDTDILDCEKMDTSDLHRNRFPKSIPVILHPQYLQKSKLTLSEESTSATSESPGAAQASKFRVLSSNEQLEKSTCMDVDTQESSNDENSVIHLTEQQESYKSMHPCDLHNNSVSIDLTNDDSDLIDPTGDERSSCGSEKISNSARKDTPDKATFGPIPNWGAICTSLPELGFVKVEKAVEKLLLYDKAIVLDPLEFDNVQELRRFLNSRLADLTYPFRKRIALNWILVTAGFLRVKTVPPTNPQFWLNQQSAKQTQNDMRNFAETKKSSEGKKAIIVPTFLPRSSPARLSQQSSSDGVKRVPPVVRLGSGRGSVGLPQNYELMIGKGNPTSSKNVQRFAMDVPAVNSEAEVTFVAPSATASHVVSLACNTVKSGTTSTTVAASGTVLRSAAVSSSPTVSLNPAPSRQMSASSSVCITPSSSKSRLAPMKAVFMPSAPGLTPVTQSSTAGLTAAALTTAKPVLGTSSSVQVPLKTGLLVSSEATSHVSVASTSTPTSSAPAIPPTCVVPPSSGTIVVSSNSGSIVSSKVLAPGSSVGKINPKIGPSDSASPSDRQSILTLHKGITRKVLVMPNSRHKNNAKNLILIPCLQNPRKEQLRELLERGKLLKKN